MERLIDPVIADLQAEYAETLRAGHIWRSHWALLAGYAAFVRVAVWCGLSGITQSWHAWSDEDQRSLVRTFVSSVSAIVLVSILLVLMGLPRTLEMMEISDRPAEAGVALLTAQLIPGILALSIPVGLAFGAALSLRGRPRSRRLIGVVLFIALGLSASSLLNLAWVVPAANQAYREEIHGGPVRKGYRELTLSELGRARGREASFEYQQRWAIACAPLTFALFGVVVAPRLRRTSAAVLVVIGLVIVYRVVGVLDPWTPQLLLIATIILLARARDRASVSQTRA